MSTERKTASASEEFILSDRGYYVFATVISVLAACAGVSAVMAGASWGWIWLVLGSVLGGLCTINLLPRASFLRFSSEGLDYVFMFKAWSFTWMEIAGARTESPVALTPPRKYRVVLELADGGGEWSLPSNLGKSQDIVEAINRWVRMSSRSG